MSQNNPWVREEEPGEIKEYLKFIKLCGAQQQKFLDGNLKKWVYIKIE